MVRTPFMFKVYANAHFSWSHRFCLHRISEPLWYDLFKLR